MPSGAPIATGVLRCAEPVVRIVAGCLMHRRRGGNGGLMVQRYTVLDLLPIDLGGVYCRRLPVQDEQKVSRMVFFWTIEHETYLRTLVLLHGLDKFNESCLAMWTLGCPGVACLVATGKQKMDGSDAALPSLEAELPKIGQLSIGILLSKIFGPLLIEEPQIEDGVFKKVTVGRLVS